MHKAKEGKEGKDAKNERIKERERGMLGKEVPSLLSVCVHVLYMIVLYKFIHVNVRLNTQIPSSLLLRVSPDFV